MYVCGETVSHIRNCRTLELSVQFKCNKAPRVKFVELTGMEERSDLVLSSVTPEIIARAAANASSGPFSSIS